MAQQPIIIDGGTGTELERRGVPMNCTAWSAEAILTHPEILAEIHADFLEAGADLLIANNFACGLHNLEAAGLGDHFERVNTQSVAILRKVVEDACASCIAAGAVSTTTFSGALNYDMLPDGAAAVDYYARQAQLQADAGAELIILEMMRDITQTTAALQGALKTGLPVWVGFSTMQTEDGRTLLLDTDIPLPRALEEVPLADAAAVGIMHTLVEHAPPAVQLVKDAWDGPAFAYPHAGHFIMPNWIFEDAITPVAFAQAARDLAAMGLDAVGGCCGITPAHIRALSEDFRENGA